MVDMKRCEKGHFYDASSFSSCPYCNPAENPANGNAADVNLTVDPNAPGSGGQVRSDAASGNIGKTMPIFGQKAQQAGGNVGKTMPVQNAQPSQNTESEDIRTVAVIRKRVHNEDNVGINPVTGWLVCIQGKDMGRDYRIFAGNNFVGRSDKMDICIHGDDTISREKHACISYDDKKNRFYIIPGDSRGLVYLNDETVFVPHLLAPYDVIELGNTKLKFVPFCNEKFIWR